MSFFAKCFHFESFVCVFTTNKKKIKKNSLSRFATKRFFLKIIKSVRKHISNATS